jgi:hypothetical protein
MENRRMNHYRILIVGAPQVVEREAGWENAGTGMYLPSQASRGAVMEHAEVNGVELAYEVMGSGIAVLFIHGAHIADSLKPLMAEPALERFQRIRYHRRGLGGSTHPVEAGPTSVAVQVQDAVRLLDHLGVGPAHVAGHSWGERSPWSSRPSTPPGWRRWCCSNRRCS